MRYYDKAQCSSVVPPAHQKEGNCQALKLFKKNKVQIKCIFTYSMILINLELKRIYFLSCCWDYYLTNSPSIVALKQEKEIFTQHGSAVNSIYSNIDKTVVYWFSTFTCRGKVMQHFFRVTDENVN